MLCRLCYIHQCKRDCRTFVTCRRLHLHPSRLDCTRILRLSPHISVFINEAHQMEYFCQDYVKDFWLHYSFDMNEDDLTGTLRRRRGFGWCCRSLSDLYSLNCERTKLCFNLTFVNYLTKPNFFIVRTIQVTPVSEQTGM